MVGNTIGNKYEWRNHLWIYIAINSMEIVRNSWAHNFMSKREIHEQTKNRWIIHEKIKKINEKKMFSSSLNKVDNQGETNI